MIAYNCIEETKAYWYAWNVVEGNISACTDVFNCCNRFLKDIEKSESEDFPYYFDLDIMAKIENVASCFKFTSGARAGEKIDLAPPQSFILGNIYGWRFKNNKKKRRFRFVLLMISRKNSKSFLIALISLMAMMDEQENETYSFAGKKEQARICFEQAKALIRSNPKVARKFKLNKLEIILKKNNSKFQPLASEEKTLDGTSPSTGIIDEAYIVPVGVKNSVSSGTGARLSPLIVCITTSYDVPSVGNWAWEDMQYTKKINEGLVDNDRHFGMIYSLDDEKEIDNPEMWEKANPLIPYSPVLMEDLHEAYKRTKLSPAELRNFKIKRMNLILDGIGIDKYLHLPSWRENRIERIDFNKKYVFYGVDLSITTDLSAVAKCVYDPVTDTFEIEVHGFAPKENIHELEVRDGIPYRQYVDEGYITLCDGRIIDQDFIIEWILKDQKQEYIAMVGYDPYNSDYMLNRLDELGINTFEIRQGYRMLSGPTKLFREYVYKHKIKYKQNPILDWCASNAITTKDKFQNEILDKVKSENKIDLLAAAIFAFLMSKPSRQSLTAMLKRFFSGGKNAGKILILDDGMKFKGLSLSPADMNLLQQKSFTVEDIARLLKMPSYMLGASGSSMVYSNVEQTQLMFLQMTIDPILRLIEDTFNKYLLTEDEKESGFFFEFNTQNMLRTTPEKEILMYANAVKGSLITVNEARRKMNWNHLKGMDRPIVMSGTYIINEHGEVIGVNSESVKGGDEDRI